MTEPILCLACGGLVECDLPLEPGQVACSCAPASEAATVSCASCGGPLRVGARACPWCRSTVATCRCPACTAWNLAGAHHCQACGRVLSDHDDQATVKTELACPRCTARLQARKYAELDVDECDQCGGMFLAPSMLDRIVREHDRPEGVRLALPKRAFQRETAVQYVRCPRCEATMNRRNFGRFSGVVVDICRDHGVWFDGGELNEVVAWIEGGGLEQARKRELDELEEQARSLRAEQIRSMQAVGTKPFNDEMPSLGTLRSFGAEFVEAVADLWTSLKK